MEAVRIIKEMRKATNGKYPTYAVWENVPGAFSSNKGSDFQTVLHEICKITEPQAPIVPVPKNGWATAGELSNVGGGSIAWRILDAQYHGVPQRRRRIILVCDFAGQRAGEILFEPKGLPGYPTEDGEAGETVAECATERTDYTSAVTYDAKGNGDGKTVCTITGDHNNSVSDYTAIVCMATGQAKAEVVEDMCTTITCSCERPIVAYSPAAVSAESEQYRVRRLTPSECAMLQGFPSNWGELPQITDMSDEDFSFWQEVRTTHTSINNKKYKPVTKEQMVKWYNKLRTDSVEYKMWGNGVALPVVRIPLHGMAQRGAKTLGSLFDGSGGFPLAGLLDGITPLWASEVEPYPIAVTKYHLS